MLHLTDNTGWSGPHWCLLTDQDHWGGGSEQTLCLTHLMIITPKNCNYLIWWLFVDINSSDSYYQLGLSNRHRKLYADELKSLRQTIISGDPDCDSWPRLECPRVSTFSALLSAGSGRCWRLYLCHSGPKEGDEENIQQDGKKYFGDWYFQIFPSIWGFSPAPWWSPWCPQISADGTGTAGQTTWARWSVKLI